MGMKFHSDYNTITYTIDELSNKKIMTDFSRLNREDYIDLILAIMSAKWTQSNSIVMAKDGQTIGIGAGQQSRVDCVKLAGEKAIKWNYMNSEFIFIIDTLFKDDISKVDKVNFLSNFFDKNFDYSNNHYISKYLRISFLKHKQAGTFKYNLKKYNDLSDVSMASDGFFPFRDNIDLAAKYGVKNIVQPGGSKNDDKIIEACQEYKMNMILTGDRMFTH